MVRKLRSIKLIFVMTSLLVSSCSMHISHVGIPQDTGSGGKNDNKAVLSSDKDIISFTILDRLGVITGTNISVTVPFGTDVMDLVPTITVSPGATISPASGIALDFSSPASYTVTAADGSTKTYMVTVTVAAADSKDIIAFSLSWSGGLGNAVGIIGETALPNPTISVTVPFGVDVSSLTPTITYTGVSIDPGSGVEQDFTDPTTYIVTAQDHSIKLYTVTVTMLPSDAKDITAFSINGMGGNIYVDGVTNRIAVNLPDGSNIAHLTPIITITGVSVSPVSGVERDFTSPVTYRVTAADSSYKDYIVTVYLLCADISNNIYYVSGSRGTDLQNWSPSSGSGGEILGGGTGAINCPFATIQKAIDTMVAANATPGEVHVDAGLYDVDHPVVVASEISILGGYSRTDWGDRRYLTNADRGNSTYSTTVRYSGLSNDVYIDPFYFAPTIEASAPGIMDSTLIEGFTILGRPGASGSVTAGILMYNGAGPHVRYNTITSGLPFAQSAPAEITTGIFSFSSHGLIDHNQINGGFANTTSCGIGIMATMDIAIENNVIGGGTVLAPSGSNASGICSQYSSGLQISSNNINGGTASARSNGIFFDNGVSGIIHGNTINGGTGDNDSVAIYLSNGSSPTIDSNTLDGGTAGSSSFGISLGGSSNPTIDSNTIDAGNAGLHTFGISFYGPSSSTIINNVINGGTSPNYSDGIFTNNGAAPTIRNNTIITGSTGVSLNGFCMWDDSGAAVFENNIIYKGDSTAGLAIHVQPASPDPQSIKNNDVYGVFDCLYYSSGGCLHDISQLNNNYPSFASGNISVDPMFADYSSMDLHLTDDTPAAVAVGGLDFSATIPVDKDDVTRVVPFTIGAYEYTSLQKNELTPIITSVVPSSAYATAGGVSPGGTIVTIHGTGLTAPSSVKIGSTSMTINSSTYTQVVATIPSGVATGTYDIRVTTAAGTSAISSADEFTFIPLTPVTLVLKMGTSVVSCGGRGSIVNCNSYPAGILRITSGDITQLSAVYIDASGQEIPFFMSQGPSMYFWNISGATSMQINGNPRTKDNSFVFPSDTYYVSFNNLAYSDRNDPNSFPSLAFNLTAFVNGVPDGCTLSGPNNAFTSIGLYYSATSSVKIAPATETYSYLQRIMFAGNKIGSGMYGGPVTCRLDEGSWGGCTNLMMDLISDTDPHTYDARGCPSGTTCSSDSDYVTTSVTYICSGCDSGSDHIARNLSVTPHSGYVTTSFELLSGVRNPYAVLFTDSNCLNELYFGMGQPVETQVFPATTGSHTANISNVTSGTYYFSIADDGYRAYRGGGGGFSNHVGAVMSKECVQVTVP